MCLGKSERGGRPRGLLGQYSQKKCAEISAYIWLKLYKITWRKVLWNEKREFVLICVSSQESLPHSLVLSLSFFSTLGWGSLSIKYPPQSQTLSAGARRCAHRLPGKSHGKAVPQSRPGALRAARLPAGWRHQECLASWWRSSTISHVSYGF